MLRDNRFGRFILLFEAALLQPFGCSKNFQAALRLLTYYYRTSIFPRYLPLCRKVKFHALSDFFHTFFSIYRSYSVLLLFFFIGFPCFSLRQGIVIPVFRYATFRFDASSLLNTSVSGFFP